MSWLSKYIKNVKAGYNGIKDDYTTNRARRNPVNPPAGLDYSNSKSSGDLLGGSRRRVKKDLDTLHKSEGYKSWKRKSNAGEYTASGSFRNQEEKGKGNTDRFRKDARKDRSNYRDIYDDDGNKIGSRYKEPKTTRGQSSEIAGSWGMSGLKKDYSDLGYEEANSRAQADNVRYRSMTSQNTSSIFNAETLAGANKFVTDAQFKIKDSINNPFNSGGTVESKTKAIVDKTQMEISNMFDTSEEFDAAYNSNAKFAETIDTLTEMGGDMANIQSKIVNKPKLSEHLGQDTQSLSEYLNIGNSASEQRAFNSLIPENQMAQDQIQKLANIPKEYANLYFGTPESIGIYQERELQAKEAKRILNEEAKDSEDNMKRQAKLAAKRYRMDFEEESANIEINRLNAKNYMTGMLAKMGALMTTGKAPVALTTLEERYQGQATRLKQNYTMATTELDIKLDNGLNDIENNLDRSILKVDTSLLDDKEGYMKQILKLQATSDKDIYKLQSSFGKEYRKQLEKYKKEAKKNSNNYIGGMYNAVSKYDVNAAGKSLGYKDGMSFEEYLSGREETEGGVNPFGEGHIGMNFSESGREGVREDYNKLQLEGKLRGLSTDAKMVMEGISTLKELTPSVKRRVKSELYKKGLMSDVPQEEDDSDSSDENGSEYDDY